jgi:hypothetical protein
LAFISEYNLQMLYLPGLPKQGAQCLVGDVSTGVFHPIVPAKFLKDFFCICTAFPLLGGWPLESSRFFWHSLANNVTNWAKSCLHCEGSKIHCNTHLLPQPIPIPQ